MGACRCDRMPFIDRPAIEAYDDFIQRVMVAINKVVPIKESRIKHNSQGLLNDEIFGAIKNHDKLLKKF